MPALSVVDEHPPMDGVVRFSATGPGGDYAVFIAKPEIDPPPGGYPVLYLLDGNAWIASSAEAVRMQSAYWHDSRMRAMLLVAIGYPGPARYNLERRAFDFLARPLTPPPATSDVKAEARGGAEAFRRWLTGALRDGIAAHHPIDRNRQYLLGHSFGGAFVLHAFLADPGSFAKYVALSPALEWDEGHLKRDLEQLLPNLPAELASELFVALGDDEFPGKPDLSRRLVVAAEDFVRNLRSRELNGLRLEQRTFHGENHMSLPLASLSASLRFLAGPGAGETSPY